jgi:hypothetical protein
VSSGWYVLYRDGAFHGVRATADFDGAIATAGELHREGRDVVQLGPLDRASEFEVIGANEIRRLCARFSETSSLPELSGTAGEGHAEGEGGEAMPMRTRRL